MSEPLRYIQTDELFHKRFPLHGLIATLLLQSGSGLSSVETARNYPMCGIYHARSIYMEAFSRKFITRGCWGARVSAPAAQSSVWV